MFSGWIAGDSFAIDLGNTNTLLANESQILVSEPSYIVFDNDKNRVKAVGAAAYDIFEKNHENLRPVKPLRWGVISDYDSAAAMIREMVNNTFSKSKRLRGFRNIISGVPFATTEVERRALRDALGQFNARDIKLLFEPLAAAIGMGLNVQEPSGKMIVDIGGGITEIVIISLSGVAAFYSTKVAGDSMTEDIQDYFRRYHQLYIGFRTSERIKMQVGSVLEQPEDVPAPAYVTGRDLKEGIPVKLRTDHREIHHILDPSFCSIEEAIINTLEVCPPELASDIYGNGIHVTGGGAMLRGVRERLEKTLSLPIHIDSDPLLSVSKGISKVLARPEKSKAMLIN